MVWACIKIIRACQDNFTRNSARREKKGPTKEVLGKQHRWMDRVEVLLRRKISWRQNKMEGEGCNICGAPMVIDYGIGVGAWVLNASYMFQPLMSFFIHTQKGKQLPSIHWKTSISHPHKEGQAVDMHIQRKKRLTWCTKDQAVTMQTQ